MEQPCICDILLAYGGLILKSKDLLSVADLSGDKIRLLISNALFLKDKWISALDDKVQVLIFEKPSLRTRLSFELAMMQLGGHTLYLSPAEVGLGKRESIRDVASVLSRYADVITSRTFSHQNLEELSKYAEVPVINALSDFEHPCQALADLLTIFEKKKKLEGLTMAYVGDGNNVAHSLMLASSLTGMNFRIASPPGYLVNEKILSMAQKNAAACRSEIFCTGDPKLAVKGADVVYTDVWVSMGQEAETAERRQVFAPYQVTRELLALAKKDAIFMHPLPAHHGEEVAENVLYHPKSVVFDQAENRLHLQKAILADILGGLESSKSGCK
jgi:ornithine carbamoyltransferase